MHGGSGAQWTCSISLLLAVSVCSVLTCLENPAYESAGSAQQHLFLHSSRSLLHNYVHHRRLRQRNSLAMLELHLGNNCRQLDNSGRQQINEHRVCSIRRNAVCKCQHNPSMLDVWRHLRAIQSFLRADIHLLSMDAQATPMVNNLYEGPRRGLDHEHFRCLDLQAPSLTSLLNHGRVAGRRSRKFLGAETFATSLRCRFMVPIQQSGVVSRLHNNFARTIR